MSIRFGYLVLLLAAVGCVASGQVTDFAIDTVGPHHVVQGHYMFFEANGRIITGTDESGTVPSISGLPAGATVQFVNMVRYCCTTTLWSIQDNNPIQISTTPSTPTGLYQVVLKYVTKEGVQRSTTYPIYVDPLPSLVHKSGTYSPPDTPLASLAKWKSDMVTYGREHCTSSEMNLYEGFVWYYDGARVYYQIADATNDPSWNSCAVMVADFFQQWVIANNGDIQGWRVFPFGMAMNYQRTGDPVSRQGVSELANSGYAAWPDPVSVIPWGTSRELSYGIEANLADQSLGGTPNPHFPDLIEYLLGDLDQWFVSKNTAYTQPFMVALAAEALIDYWNVSHDPRIPPALQMAADMLWTQSFDSGCQCMRYYNTDGTSYLSTDLNLLIAPLYGWVFQQTKFQGYRDQGDQLFNSGVAGAYLDGGKQFSQNYRWSGKYVEWRTLAAQSQLSCDLNSDGNVNVLDVQLATNQVLGYATCGSGDLVGNGQCTIVDVQRIISASLGASCHLGP